MKRARHSAEVHDVSIGDRAFALLQYALPTHWLSSLAYRLTRVRMRWFARASIRLFMRIFSISLTEVKEQNIAAFNCFNDFFTRELNDGARPLPRDAATTVICPVDGRLSQIGEVSDGRIIQAKGRDYSVTELLGGDDLAAHFHDGVFFTLYLAPGNYHRVHMPCAGTLRRARLIPGRLFSVNPATARTVPRLFARNERFACLFGGDTGPFAVVMIGAMLVGSIETVWAGRITPPRARKIATHEQSDDSGKAVRLGCGAEMGRFNMGSSVVLLFPRGSARRDPALVPGQAVRMGQALGEFPSLLKQSANERK